MHKYVLQVFIFCSYFDDLMDLFSPDPEEVTSPTYNPDDLSSISEDTKEDDLFQDEEAPPIQVCGDTHISQRPHPYYRWACIGKRVFLKIIWEFYCNFS